MEARDAPMDETPSWGPSDHPRPPENISSADIHCRSWASVVHGVSKPDLSEFLEAAVEQGIEGPEVLIDPRAYEEMKSPFQYAAIAGLLGGNARPGTDFSFIFEALRGQWTKVQNPLFSVIGNGRFMVRVSFEAELEEILRKKAWKVGNKTLITSRWRPGEEMKIKVEQSIEMWVRLPQLPVELWNEYTFQGIAKALRGCFLEEDPCTRKWEKLGFARVKMEVPLSFHPVPKITLRNGKGLAVPQAIIYEARITYCSRCGALTHPEASCKFKRLASEESDQCKNPWDEVQVLQRPRDRKREHAPASALRQKGPHTNIRVESSKGGLTRNAASNDAGRKTSLSSGPGVSKHAPNLQSFQQKDKCPISPTPNPFFSNGGSVVSDGSQSPPPGFAFTAKPKYKGNKRGAVTNRSTAQLKGTDLQSTTIALNKEATTSRPSFAGENLLADSEDGPLSPVKGGKMPLVVKLT